MSKIIQKQRTIQQNKALHLYFTWMANTLNDAGLDMRKTLKPEIEIPWNGKTVKEYLWRPIQELQLRKTSTTELTSDEIDVVYNTLNRFLGEKLGVQVDFPSIEGLMLQIDNKEYEQSK